MFEFSNPYLQYFLRLKESAVFLVVEREQDVYFHPAVFVLKHEAVSELGGPRGARRAAAALAARILDQTLPPGAEGFHGSVGGLLAQVCVLSSSVGLNSPSWAEWRGGAQVRHTSLVFTGEQLCVMVWFPYFIYSCVQIFWSEV